MIGRFARGMSDKLPAPLIAGLILFAVGGWFASLPLQHAYPTFDQLEALEGTAFDAIEVRRRRGAFLRFLTDDALEVQAAVNPGEEIVIYSTSMPRYDAFKEALTAGPAIFYRWPGAPDERERYVVWQLENAGGMLMTLEESVAALKAARLDAAWLPGAIALFGLVLIVHGLRLRRAALRTNNRSA
jgi:hypothetical protein